MIYKNSKEIITAVCEAAESGLGGEVKYLYKLWKIYQEALHNPPKGVIGVGAITYAEQVLQQSQKEEEQ